MIIYWNTLEKSATDPATIPAYMATDYFGGTGRVISTTTYPTSPPYGAIRYRSDLKEFYGFKQDSGWGGLGGKAGVYPPVAGDNVALGPSGDLVLPADFTAKVKAKARVYSNVGITNMNNGQEYIVPLDTENYDPGSNFDTSTYRLTAPVTGYYYCNAGVTYVGSSVVSNKRYSMILKINGVNAQYYNLHAAVTDWLSLRTTDILYIEKDQYLEVYAIQFSDQNTVDIQPGTIDTFLTVHLLST